jgi:hypothetical protein
MRADIRLVVMLQCGHSVLFNAGRLDRVMPDIMLCEECKANVRVWATECREYKLECSAKGCRYSRWFGNSLGDCERAASRHMVKDPTHATPYRYRLHPDKFKYVRGQLGRKALVYIDGTPDLRVVVKYKAVDPDEECPF